MCHPSLPLIADTDPAAALIEQSLSHGFQGNNNLRVRIAMSSMDISMLGEALFQVSLVSVKHLVEMIPPWMDMRESKRHIW